MSTARTPQPTPNSDAVIAMTLQAIAVAEAAAHASAHLLRDGGEALYAEVKQREDELDTLDREVNEAVTNAITQCPAERARELLACLKLVIELERISDLLQGFANRVHSIAGRLAKADRQDLGNMASLLERMVRGSGDAFRARDPKLSVQVLRMDAEMDRIRNLLVVRHIENPAGEPRAESFHVVFMAQMLERGGDHAKNIAEEVVHLATGRSVRHLLRTYDKPWENMFVDYMRRQKEPRS